ncbi:trigger factor [bacterium]|nr:trigger factor [bacterium]
MKVTVTDLGDCKRQLDVEMPFEDVKPHIDRAFKKYQKRVNIDGFRKGKVPMSMLKKVYGDAIQAEVVDDLIQECFRIAVVQENLAIVAPGAIKDMKFEDGKPFTFTSEIEVEPEVEVKDYKGLKLEKVTVKVAKKEVDQTLKMIQEQKADQVEIKTAAKKGDLVEGDVQSLDESGVAIEGERWEGRVFQLGEPPIGHLIGDQLDGAKAGDVRRFSITVPKEESGVDIERTDNYEITVTSIKKKVLPKLDDAFAAEMGEFKTLDELKQNVHERITAQREEESARYFKQQLIDETIKRNEFVLPDAMIENVLDHMWEDFQKQPQAEMTADQFRTARRPEVVWNLKWSKLWSAIAIAESLTVSEDEIQSEIDKVVNASGNEDKKMKSWFKDEQHRQHLGDSLLEDKVFALIREEAKIKQVTPKAPTPPKSE